MKVVLATGIYPPDIGGPATYCHALARELSDLGHDVSVVTYGEGKKVESGKWKVHRVHLGLPILRWFLYARKLREVASDADVVYAFSSISCGVPLILSGLKNPRKVLRLGGDFFWERYTDRGGRKSLREYHASSSLSSKLMGWILRHFDHIVFSTEFQQQIYLRAFAALPDHSVIHNARACEHQSSLQHQSPHAPFRLLFMGRFVQFKNLFSLIQSLHHLPECVLTLVGEGPLDDKLRAFVDNNDLAMRVQFCAPQSGHEKLELFASHDLLVLPSLTEISPNTALEAAESGMPVLLTSEHGLVGELTLHMDEADLRTAEEISLAVEAVRADYPVRSKSNAGASRSWREVADEHTELFF